MTPAEERFKNCVKSLWDRGIYPGPTAINIELHGVARRNLGGSESRWRREAFKELDIPYLRPDSRVAMDDLNYPPEYDLQ